MNRIDYIEALRSSLLFFNNSTSCLSEADSTFTPQEGLMSVSQQIAHVALTVDWFLEPLIKEGAFNLEFEKLHAQIMEYTSVEASRKWLESSYKKAIELLDNENASFMTERLPEGPIMGGAEKIHVFDGILDHTAHHRGVLTMYARLLHKTPSMPYTEV